MSYSDLLKDPRWQKKRLEILNRDKFTCQHCSSTEKTLHAHHLFYITGMRPWDYADHVLITLCEECHKNEEDKKKKGFDEFGYKYILRLWLDPLVSEMFEKTLGVESKSKFFEDLLLFIRNYAK